MSRKKSKVEEPSQVVREGQLVPINIPPFSLDFNYGIGTRTIALPNGMDILMVAKIYTDLLDKYKVKYEVTEKPNQ